MRALTPKKLADALSAARAHDPDFTMCVAIQSDGTIIVSATGAEAPVMLTPAAARELASHLRTPEFADEAEELDRAAIKARPLLAAGTPVKGMTAAELVNAIALWGAGQRSRGVVIEVAPRADGMIRFACSALTSPMLLTPKQARAIARAIKSHPHEAGCDGATERAAADLEHAAVAAEARPGLA